MILCHACGQLLLPDQQQSGFEASRDHCLDEHLSEMRSGDLMFSDVLEWPEALNDPTRYHLFGLVPVGPRVPPTWSREDLRWPWRFLGWHR